jgi:hypothetical protein
MPQLFPLALFSESQVQLLLWLLPLQFILLLLLVEVLLMPQLPLGPASLLQLLARVVRIISRKDTQPIASFCVRDFS